MIQNIVDGYERKTQVKNYLEFAFWSEITIIVIHSNGTDKTIINNRIPSVFCAIHSVQCMELTFFFKSIWESLSNQQK